LHKSMAGERGFEPLIG